MIYTVKISSFQILNIYFSTLLIESVTCFASSAIIGKVIQVKELR